MNFLHANQVNKRAELNLIHDILNPPKRTNNLNGHYYSIIHGCMNIRNGREKFKNFRILLDSGFSLTSLIRRLIKTYS